VAYVELFVISECALAQEGRVLRADKRKVNDRRNNGVVGKEAYHCGKQMV
jgi:hypothetical protein